MELWRCECVDQTGLGYNEQENLSTSEDRQFISLEYRLVIAPASRDAIDAIAMMSCGLTNLLHDSCLALREGDVTARLIGDELDLNLASLTTWLVVIIIIVVGCGRAWTLDAASIA